MKDLTYIIPARIESEDRLKNIIDENEKQFLEENDIWSTW